MRRNRRWDLAVRVMDLKTNIDTHLDCPTELEHLAEKFGGPLVSALPISKYSAPNRMRGTAYRLEFESGLILKGRAGLSRSVILRLKNILAELPQQSFSQIRAYSESVILEEWAEGGVLSSLPHTPGLLAECGRFLGALHSAPCHGQSVGNLKTTRYRHWLKESTLHLLFKGFIDLKWAEETLNLILLIRPDSADYGFVHRDFGPDNIVLRGENLCAIDQQLVGCQAYHEDLARTWYRWDCDDELLGALLDGYRERRPVGSFLEEQKFWKLSVLLRAADFQSDAGHADVCRALLQRVDELLMTNNDYEL